MIFSISLLSIFGHNPSPRSLPPSFPRFHARLTQSSSHGAYTNHGTPVGLRGTPAGPPTLRYLTKKLPRRRRPPAISRLRSIDDTNLATTDEYLRKEFRQMPLGSDRLLRSSKWTGKRCQLLGYLNLGASHRQFARYSAGTWVRAPPPDHR